MLRNRLAEEGFSIHLRTLQRDLLELSEVFPLECDNRGKPYGWSWRRDARVYEVPGMDAPTALTFWMAETFLRPLLPPAATRPLAPHFERAREILDALPESGLAAWRERVRIVPRGLALEPPAVAPEVAGAVYSGLLAGRRLALRYRARSHGQTLNDYTVSPLGLVVRDYAIYLIAGVDSDPAVRQFALHRMESAEALQKPAHVPPGFTLDGYLGSGALDYSIEGGTLALRARVSGSLGEHLTEARLAPDQSLGPQRTDGRRSLVATVPDTAQLRWWILGLGTNIEILAPETLREEILQSHLESAARYRAA